MTSYTAKGQSEIMTERETTAVSMAKKEWLRITDIFFFYSPYIINTAIFENQNQEKKICNKARNVLQKLSLKKKRITAKEMQPWIMTSFQGKKRKNGITHE